MRLTVALAMAIMMAAGSCGGEAASEPDVFASTEWSADLGPYCAAGITFGDARDFTRILLCLLPDGEVGEESESGTYSVHADRINMTIEDSTCPDAAQYDSPGFSIMGKRMQLQEPPRLGLAGNVASYALTPPGTGTQTTSPVTLGCFGALGQARDFTAAP